jgi:hypothetical protein
MKIIKNWNKQGLRNFQVLTKFIYIYILLVTFISIDRHRDAVAAAESWRADTAVQTRSRRRGCQRYLYKASGPSPVVTADAARTSSTIGPGQVTAHRRASSAGDPIHRAPVPCPDPHLRLSLSQVIHLTKRPGIFGAEKKEKHANAESCAHERPSARARL